MESLYTERLTLRPWELSDADFVFDMYSRWEVQRFIGGAQAARIMTDRSEAVARIKIWQSFSHPVHGFWAIEKRESTQVVGTLLLKFIPASGPTLPLRASEKTEIGWHLHPRYWGNGYASEAAEAGLQHAFAHGIANVMAVTSPDNIASQKVCARIGMSHRGQTSDYYNETNELFTIDAELPDS